MNTVQKSKRSVALLGNMNNNLSSIARYLEEEGYNVELLLFSDDFFYPVEDCYGAFRPNCRRLSWGTAGDLIRIPSHKVREELERPDVLIGCGYSPAFGIKARRDIDIFVPYGGDICEQVSYTPRSIGNIPVRAVATTMQRLGLGKVKVVHFSERNPVYSGQIERFCPNSERWWEGIPMVHLNTYCSPEASKSMDESPVSVEIRRLRERYRFIAVSHNRHVWIDKKDQSGNNKRTDILLKGWAEYIVKQKVRDALLCLFEYGKDLEHSKRLIAELGIEDSVHWWPKSPRRDIMAILTKSDLVFGQFGGAWDACGTVYEALATGRPVITRRNEDQDYSSLYEVLPASEPLEIAEQLEWCREHPDQIRAIGERGRKWYSESLVKPCLKRYVEYINGI